MYLIAWSWETPTVSLWASVVDVAVGDVTWLCSTQPSRLDDAFICSAYVQLSKFLLKPSRVRFCFLTPNRDLGLQHTFTLQYQFDINIFCDSHQIPSARLSKSPPFPHNSYCTLFSPSWVTNRLKPLSAFLLFISCHLFCSSLSYCPSARQENEGKGNKCMHPQHLLFLAASLSVLAHSLCHPPKRITLNYLSSLLCPL